MSDDNDNDQKPAVPTVQKYDVATKDVIVVRCASCDWTDDNRDDPRSVRAVEAAGTQHVNASDHVTVTSRFARGTAIVLPPLLTEEEANRQLDRRLSARAHEEERRWAVLIASGIAMLIVLPLLYVMLHFALNGMGH